jgi:hypothetical protein
LTIILLVEGSTEKTLTDKIKEFLDERATAHGRSRVRLQTRKIKSTSPEALGRQIKLELQSRNTEAVVGLIDVFPQFQRANAAAAKRFLIEVAHQVGVTRGFYAHAAQYDVEAWLLPYWDDICRRIGAAQGRPGSDPEQVDGNKPPSYHLQDLYQSVGRKYVKTTEMSAILKGKDLVVAANVCAELKSLLNTLLQLNGLPLLP